MGNLWRRSCWNVKSDSLLKISIFDSDANINDFNFEILMLKTKLNLSQSQN
jgi:hypothetical protein